MLRKVEEFVRKHNAPVDVDISTTFDVCLTPEFAAYEAASYDAYKVAGGDVSSIQFYEGAAARAKTGVPGAITAYEWPAGSSHPAKLAHFLLQTAIDKGVTLLTHCAASEITRVADSSAEAPAWNITTPRGNIVASTVIHCTNAHAAKLLPHLAPHLTPNRAQAHSLVAPPAFSGEARKTSTYSLRYSLHHFYSLIQRRGDGTLILGVSRSNPTLSDKTLAETVSIDDSYYNQEILEDAVENFGRIFPYYKAEDGVTVHGEGVDHAWNGIIAMTTDSVPFVGTIEQLPGQYICAGFNGHGECDFFPFSFFLSAKKFLTRLFADDIDWTIGMARIFTCAPGVAMLATGKTWSDTGLPECFQMTQERLDSFASRSTQSVW